MWDSPVQACGEPLVFARCSYNQALLQKITLGGKLVPPRAAGVRTAWSRGLDAAPASHPGERERDIPGSHWGPGPIPSASKQASKRDIPSGRKEGKRDREREKKKGSSFCGGDLQFTCPVWFVFTVISALRLLLLLLLLPPLRRLLLPLSPLPPIASQKRSSLEQTEPKRETY